MRVLRGRRVGDTEDEFDDESEAGETFGSRRDAVGRKKMLWLHDALLEANRTAPERPLTLNQFPRRVGSASAASSGNRADQPRAGEARGRGLRDGGGRQPQRRYGGQ